MAVEYLAYASNWVAIRSFILSSKRLALFRWQAPEVFGEIPSA
jgi:hypothetical protein